LATSLSKLGDFFMQQGLAKEAVDHYSEAKTLHEALLEVDRSSIQYLFDYALIIMRLGRVFRMAGLKTEAFDYFRHAQLFLRQLVEQLPGEINFKNHLDMVDQWLEEPATEEAP
jgi:tetratricopeptide (TPR) repeat protein